MAINRKRNKWQVRVRDQRGGWFAAKTFLRKVDAEKYERDLIISRDNGQMALNPAVRAITINAFAQLWFNECRTNVSIGWQQTQLQIFRDHISPDLGETKLNQIRKREIELLMGKLSEKGLAPQSRVHVYSLLRKMFEDAIHHFEIINVNPVTAKFKPKVPRQERNYLPQEEALKLLNFARNHWLGPAIWLSTLAALRPCEVQALKWSAVDLKSQRIIINSAYNRKEKRLQDHPKQENWGSAPIPLPLARYLSELKANSRGEFVAPSTDQLTMLSYDSYYKGLKLLCNELSLLNVTPHELRHSATDIYYRAGASEEDLRRLLNHSSGKTTQNYIHRTEVRLKAISDNIGQTGLLKLVP